MGKRPGPVEGAGQWGSVMRQGQGQGLRPGGGRRAGPFIIRMEGGGEAKGGWNIAVGEGSMQRAATISRFRLIWKGGAGKIPVGVAGGHPGLISHPWAAFGTPYKLEGKAPGRSP